MRRCEGAWVPQWAQLRWRRRRGSRCRRRARATTARWTAGRWCRPQPRPTVPPTLLTEEVRHWHLHLQTDMEYILSIIYAQATKSTVRMDQVWRRMGRVWWPTGPWWPRSRSRRAAGRMRPTRRRCPLLAPPTSSSWRASSSPTRSRGPKRFVVCFAWLFNIQIKWCLTGKCYCGRNSLISIFNIKVWWLFFIGFPFSYHLKFKICSNCDASLSKNDEYARYLEMEMKTLTFHTFVVRKKSWQWVQRSNQHYLTLNERRCWVSMNRPVVRTEY